MNSHNFPYEPYPQQVQLMNKIYETINEKKVGVFESPTGTGKSLSILCSTLNWILKNEEEEECRLKEIKKKLVEMTEKTKNDVDWVTAYDERRKFDLETSSEIDKLEKKKNILKQITQNRLKRKIPQEKESISYEIKNSNDDEWIIDYDSDTEFEGESENIDDGYITKVYYCSRTHSQLAQVIKELKKTVYSNKIVVSSLGSRQNLCINKSVNMLKSINLINEKCLDIQKKETNSKKQKSESKNCNFKSLKSIEEMSQEIIAKTMDIEDLFAKGLKLGACPFYGIRQTIHKSHLVLLPYQNLLNPAARASSSIKLTDNIVIIDEAHNLADTISSINSVTITYKSIQTCSYQINAYFNKYMDRLSNKNLLYLRQIIAILKNLDRFVRLTSDTSFDCTEFLFKAYINNFKLDQILKYLERSKLAFKLRGFINSEPNEEVIVKNRSFSDLFSKQDQENIDCKEETEQVLETGNSMLILKNFLAAIVYGLDAKILVIKGVSLRFLVVDPGKYLTDIVQESRSVIVIGGTMQPFNDFTDRLLKVAGCTIDRINTFSCDHIVEAKSQLRLMTLGNGIEGDELKFTFENRSNEFMVTSTGRIVEGTLRSSPNGAIIFFASYQNMQTMLDSWKLSKIYSDIERIKVPFIEPKQASLLDSVMRNYTVAAKSTKGAVLFAVIGGKMSEGINFDDKLARLVIIIGVPFPQINDPVLQEKKRFLEINYGADAGKTMYHNLAMKAVNQAIGRAIRHKLDYAAVLLVDARYGLISRINEAEQGKLGLPKWMRESLSNHSSLTTVTNTLCEFFSGKI